MTINDFKLIELIKNGSVGVIPTDTVYGLATSAFTRTSVERLYKLKNRENKPGTVIAASIEQLAALGLDKEALNAASRFWPGPVSVVVPAKPELHYLDRGMGLAVRIPDVPALQKLLQTTGPLLTSSANQPAQPPANNLEEARVYFGDSVDFYVDGGDLSGNSPSTLIKRQNGNWVVLRQGDTSLNVH